LIYAWVRPDDTSLARPAEAPSSFPGASEKVMMIFGLSGAKPTHQDAKTTIKQKYRKQANEFASDTGEWQCFKMTAASECSAKGEHES